MRHPLRAADSLTPTPTTTTARTTVRRALGLVAVVALLLAVPVLAAARGAVPPDDPLPAPNVRSDVLLDEVVFASFSFIGSGLGLVVLVGLAVFVLVHARRGADALFLWVSVFGATLVGLLVKDLFALPRPEIPTAGRALIVDPPVLAVAAAIAGGTALAQATRWRRPALVAGAILLGSLAIEWATERLVRLEPGLEAFPSGHAVGSMAFAVAAVILGWRDIRRPDLVALLVAVSVAYVAGVGISRVYLGVHFPIDVVAGWCVGAAWVLAVHLSRDVMSRRPLRP